MQLSVTVQQFLNQLKEKMQIPDPQRVRLVYAGVTMTETQKRSLSGVTPGDTVQLHMCLAGGMQGDRGVPSAPGAHISSLIPFRGEEQKDDEEMVQSPNPVSGSLVVHPHSAVSESSIQLLGTGWTRSQTGQLQLLPNPLPAVQIDRALFVLGDLQVVPRVDMSPAVFNQHASAFLNTMTQQGADVGGNDSI